MSQEDRADEIYYRNLNDWKEVNDDTEIDDLNENTDDAEELKDDCVKQIQRTNAQCKR